MIDQKTNFFKISHSLQTNLTTLSTFSPSSLKTWNSVWNLHKSLHNLWPHRKEKSVGDLFWKSCLKRGRVKWSGDPPLTGATCLHEQSWDQGLGSIYALIRKCQFLPHFFWFYPLVPGSPPPWRKQYLCERAFGRGQNWIVQMKEVNCVAPPWGTASLRSACLGKSTGKY